MADQFYGDRVGVLEDPFGHRWSFATHIEDVSPEEMQKRAAAHHRGLMKNAFEPQTPLYLLEADPGGAIESLSGQSFQWARIQRPARKAVAPIPPSNHSMPYRGR